MGKNDKVGIFCTQSKNWGPLEGQVEIRFQRILLHISNNDILTFLIMILFQEKESQDSRPFNSISDLRLQKNRAS